MQEYKSQLIVGVIIITFEPGKAYRDCNANRPFAIDDLIPIIRFMNMPPWSRPMACPIGIKPAHQPWGDQPLVMEHINEGCLPLIGTLDSWVVSADAMASEPGIGRCHGFGRCHMASADAIWHRRSWDSDSGVPSSRDGPLNPPSSCGPLFHS